MLEPSANVFSQVAEVALGWIVAGCERDELLAALHQFCRHAHWRDAVAEANSITHRDSVAIVVKHKIVCTLHSNLKFKYRSRFTPSFLIFFR